MIVKNVATLDDLERALHSVNARFDGNVRMIATLVNNNQDWKVDLKVFDCHGSGAPFRTRATSQACWHVYGFFFDALPEYAVIVVQGRKVRPNDPWHDWKLSQYRYPFYASQACDCGPVHVGKTVVMD